MLFRFALVLDIPFNRFECEIDVGDDDGKLEVTGGENLITVWELKQRAYVKGQTIINERVELRDAVLSALGIVHRDPKKVKDPEKDAFRDAQLSIAYNEARPLMKYAKERREYMKQRRNKING